MAILRPRARIVRTIGDQLISGPEAAIIEMVKNAYDADSPSVAIKIFPRTASVPVGAIVVTDCGHGMSLSDIEDRWLEPATDDKLRRRRSPKGRAMLGAKGIGRFAASRLGSATVVRSVTTAATGGSCEEVLVQVDWDQFSSDLYLDDIDIPLLGPRSPATSQTGVQISISDLRDDWTQKRLENLIRELRRLITDSTVGEDFELHLDLSEFTTETSGLDGKAIFEGLSADVLHSVTIEEPRTDGSWRVVPFRLHDHADYVLRGSFDEDGLFKGDFRIDRGDGETFDLHVPPPPLTRDEAPCGRVEMRLSVYDRETESIEALFRRMGLDFDRIGIRAARKILSSNAGIGISRHGFRIRPYGEPENDWLNLEAQRVQDPSRKLGISQVSGSVSIQGEDQSGLVERSSREGLEHNGHFARLKSLLRGVLLHVEQRRQAFRDKAGLSRKRRTDLEDAKAVGSLQAVRRAAQSLPPPLRASVERAIERDATSITNMLDEVDEYQKLLQSRASLGLVVAQVIHEGRRILNPMAAAARVLMDNHEHLLDQTRKGEILRQQLPGHVDRLNTGTREMSRLFKRLDPVSGRRRGRPTSFDVSAAIEASLSLFSDAIDESRIEARVEPNGPLTAHGYKEDFQAAALNILENAIHWLQGNPPTDRRLEISFTRRRQRIEVAIENNGPPIDPDYMDRLFEPGFSLRTEGSGLGLSIAREACRASKGDLYIKDGPFTRFVISFPRAAS